jgi:hypothetical protein
MQCHQSLQRVAVFLSQTLSFAFVPVAVTTRQKVALIPLRRLFERRFRPGVIRALGCLLRRGQRVLEV